MRMSGKTVSRTAFSVIFVGDFLEAELIKKPFNLDPPGAITIDSRVNSGMLDSLGKAINTGAIVCTDSLETPWSSLRGKTFRLSYLLAHDYRLVLRAGRDVSLSFALRNAGQIDFHTETTMKNQRRVIPMSFHAEDIEDTKYDLFIATTGFESRASWVAENLRISAVELLGTCVC